MVIWSIILLLSLSSIAIATVVQLVSADEFGNLIRIGGAPYYALAPTVGVTTSNIDVDLPTGFLPVTSIHVVHSPIRREFLEKQVRLYENVDDVWNRNFLESVSITYQGPAGCFFDDEAIRWMEENRIKFLFLSGNINIPKIEGTKIVPMSTEGPPTGPYAIGVPISRKFSDPFSFHKVYRLFRDDLRSFISGLIPRADGNGWVQTNLTLPSDPDQVQYIPVPSRLAILSVQLPLSGMRFGLKDIFDAQGVPTSAGSTAYAKTYGEASETAPSIKKLIGLGATLVGKARTSQFAHGAHPWEFIDYSYSWNPRGDGQLTASASSSGSATAIAGYNWLDFAVGSDTRGSVRKPASLVGVYGIRPTFGSLDLTGVVPLADGLDTAGFFARDPVLFYEISRHWYSDSPVWSRRTTTRFPRTLYYPTEHFPLEKNEAQLLVDAFVKNLKRGFNITHVPVNFTDKITPYFPGGDFAKFQMYSNQICEYHSYRSVGKPFIDRYTQENNHKAPSLDPIPQAMFDRAQHITEEQYNSATSLKISFTSSISENIFKQDFKSCSDSLFIYDAGTGGFPSYRTEELNQLDNAVSLVLTRTSGPTPARFSDFYTYLGSMAGLPEVTIPIGQASYFSQVTNEWNFVPVSVQLVTRAGCDAMLMDLVKKLAELGVISTVTVGRTAF